LSVHHEESLLEVKLKTEEMKKMDYHGMDYRDLRNLGVLP
jgi:hypothetical protein